MNVLRYEPNNVFAQFHNEMNRLLHNEPGHTQAARTLDERGAKAWAPAVDVKEEDERFVINADVPGVSPKDIEITMDDGVLSIKGSRNSDSHDATQAYAKVERVYGEFERRFNLPDSADSESIAASSENGVLSISIPKKAVMQPRRIEIQ